MDASAYSTEFFEALRDGARRSAEVVVPLVLEWINPKTLVDLGCGDGTWLSVFRGDGVENILGIDGNYISPEILQIPKECFIARDLSQPVLLDQRFDLAVSLEVAEHLPESSASEFVKSLVQLSDVVLFSAAIPHQGGTNHINEQWPDYWFNLFKDQGYLAVDLLRERIWNHPKVEPWYAQNSFLIVRSDRLDDYPALKNSFAHAHGLEQTIVHPKIYLSHFPDTPTHLSQSENAKPDIPQNIKITDVRLNPSAEIQTGDSLLIEISYQRMSPEKSAIFTLSLSDAFIMIANETEVCLIHGITHSRPIARRDLARNVV